MHLDVNIPHWIVWALVVVGVVYALCLLALLVMRIYERKLIRQNDKLIEDLWEKKMAGHDVKVAKEGVREIKK